MQYVVKFKNNKCSFADMISLNRKVGTEIFVCDTALDTTYIRCSISSITEDFIKVTTETGTVIEITVSDVLKRKYKLLY